MKTELTLNVLQTMSAQEYEDIRAAGSDERRELTHAVMRELDAPDNWTMNGEYGSEFGGFFPVQVRFTPAHERFHLALCSPGDVSQVWVLVLVNVGGEPFAVVQVQRRFAPEDTVTVTLGGKTYTATVQGNLSWSVDVPAADIQAIGNGDLTVNASVTNGVGNTGSGSRDITIDANLPGLRVDTVAGDDVVNSIETLQFIFLLSLQILTESISMIFLFLSFILFTVSMQSATSWCGFRFFRYGLMIFPLLNK